MPASSAASPWTRMDRQPRCSMSELTASQIPLAAGVYALYREGQRIYVGKAKSLRQRVWRNHSGRGRSMGTSAMRRNVAQHLGFGVANDIKLGLVRLTAQQAATVRAWLDDCNIAWIQCENEAVALLLEARLKDEFMPPLTKQ